MKTSSKVIGLAVERGLFRHRKRLLLELANLRKDGIDRFRLRVIGRRFPHEPDRLLENYSDALRETWKQPTAMAQSLVDRLIHQSVIEFANVGFIAPITEGRLTAHPQNLQGQLAVAILENWRLFAVCGNPDCKAPYFLAKRRTQKYCEDDACTNYAQRRYALKWWDKEGRKRREQNSRLISEKGN